MGSEQAERIGQSPNATSNNMAVVRNAGIVTQSRNRLYQIVPQFLADTTNRILDVGYCLPWLNAGS